MNSIPYYTFNPGPPHQDISTTFFARDDHNIGPWWRLPREMQQMVMRFLCEDQLTRETGNAAHWFLLDYAHCTAPSGTSRIRNLNVQDRKTWLPEHLTSFIRLRAMEQPLVRRQPGDNRIYRDHAPQFLPWGNATGYFGRDNPSLSRRRRNLFRTRVPDHARALRSLLRNSLRTKSPYIFYQLPRPMQADHFEWLSNVPRALINGLKPSAPPEDPDAKEGFSYMVIDSVDDLVIIQNKHPNLEPLPDPRFIKDFVPRLDHFLVSSVYKQFENQRQIGYELNLAGGEQKAYEDPTSAEFGDDPLWNSMFWSVVHFPRLETVWLVNYNLRLRLNRRPRGVDWRFQARGLDFYEVAWPTALDAGVWDDCEGFLKLAEKLESKMLSHWQAWCYTRLNDTGGLERAIYSQNGQKAALTRSLDIATFRMKPNVPDYQMVTEFWNRRAVHEPEYWERMAPAGPTPKIRVKVLAVVKHGAVDHDCWVEDVEEVLRKARLGIVDEDEDVAMEAWT
ncbi:hypothetical protein PspLS_01133 [Pyricularia sp. CBS 133598]|nr:hypothetical protein PspLS_01133 [Pyricularia sp. CBS 133598]